MNEHDLKRAKLLSTAPTPFIPEKLPLDTFKLITPDLLRLLTQANKAIGEYIGFLLNTPNPDLLLSPITTQEAVLSSKLEGTHATLEDILNHEAGNQTSIEIDELNEILNYRKALNFAFENISQLKNLSNSDSKSPLTVKLIKEMHKILLSNVRGSTKHPGNFKIAQNYIGSYQKISFTPLPAELTEEYMSNLERYIHMEDIDYLIQAAILHAQFEMIHPFEDGNGRIGRLLIPLFFYYTSLIPLPIFYMSAYFEKDRALYIQKLSEISSSNAWAEWIAYFLNGIIVQSNVNTNKAKSIQKLYEEFKEYRISIKSAYYIDILDFIFNHPIFNASQLTDQIKASKQTVYTILNKMVDSEIITSSTLPKNKIYICEKILDLVNQ